MEVQQGLEHLFGDPHRAIGHLGLGHRAKPGLMIFGQGRVAGLGVVGLLRRLQGDVEFNRAQGRQPLEIGRQLRHQVGKAVEAAQRLDQPVDMPELHPLELLEAAERDIALIPEAVLEQPQQEHQLGRPRRSVQGQEAAGAGRRPRAERRPAAPEESRAAELVAAEQAFDPVVVIQDRHRGLEAHIGAVGQVVPRITTVLGDVDGAVRGRAEALQEGVQGGGDLRSVRQAFVRRVEHHPGGA